MPIIPSALTVIAFWPIWKWYFSRITDGSDEPWGILAVFTAGFLLLMTSDRKKPAEINLVAACCLMLLYAVSYPYVPRLVQAALALSATALILCDFLGKRLSMSIWGLFILGLPIVASMQFFLGYPMRAVSGFLSAKLLNLGGLSVVQQGILLTYGDLNVLVDAPCSGVRMLWAGIYLCLTLSALFGFGCVKTLLFAGGGTCIVIAANAVRSAALFYLETGIIKMPQYCHEAAGVLVFAGAGAIILFMGFVLKSDGVRIDSAENGHISQDVPEPGKQIRKAPAGFYAAACCLACFVPLFSSADRITSNSEFPGWPCAFEGNVLTQLDISDKDKTFEKDFPGRIAKFTDGRRILIIRWVHKETRKLHPASDCFKAAGYKVHPESAVRGRDSDLWSGFRANRHDESLRVLERIQDACGRTWSDVPAWYWSAFLGKSVGPWWSITMIYPENSK